MAYFNISDDVQLYYEEQGEGQPVIFIHGVWMSSRFFHKQMPYFGEKYHAFALDLRGHGRSSHVPYGHTIDTYAQDLHTFIKEKGLKDVTLVGWSMGAMVIWYYFKQFGAENIKATVVVDQSPSDFRWEDWPYGFADFEELCGIMSQMQTDRAGFVSEFIPAMFKNPPSEEDFKWMFEEVTLLPECIAGAIIFDEAVQDYRPVLDKVTVPTLLCFERDEKIIPTAAGEYLRDNMSDARLIIFEDSGHCLFIEEADRFNQEVDQFIQSLD